MYPGMYPKHPGLYPSQRYGVLNPLIHPVYVFLKEKAVSGSLRLASPPRRKDEGHRVEVGDGPRIKTVRLIWLLIWARPGPGDGAWHARPTST